MTFGILEVAAFITALGVIGGMFLSTYKLARKVEEKITSYDQNLEQLNLHLNKMALLNTDLPLIDRLHAGEWYLAHGGNGMGKKVYNQLLEELDTTVWGNTTWAESQYRSYQGKKKKEEEQQQEFLEAEYDRITKLKIEKNEKSEASKGGNKN